MRNREQQEKNEEIKERNVWEEVGKGGEKPTETRMAATQSKHKPNGKGGFRRVSKTLNKNEFINTENYSSIINGNNKTAK